MEKIFIFIILAALVFCIGFFVYFWNAAYQEHEGTILEQVTYEPIENYEIIETEQGTFVENKNVGLRFKVPEGWEVEKDIIASDQHVVTVLSPGAKTDSTMGILQQGCGASVRVEHRYSEKEFKSLANLIQGIQENPEDDYTNYQILTVANRPALQGIFFDDKKIGKAILVSLPIDEKVYIFETLILPQEKERCSEIFEEFLETVTIS